MWNDGSQKARPVAKSLIPCRPLAHVIRYLSCCPASLTIYRESWPHGLFQLERLLRSSTRMPSSNILNAQTQKGFEGLTRGQIIS